MSVATELPKAPPSPAGPLNDGEAAGLRDVPEIALPRLAQTLRISIRHVEFVFGARRRLGEVFRMRTALDPGGLIVTSHPDHVRSLFTAKPELAPSLTGESPLRPIVGPNSTLTALGERHMRQRKMHLPQFHGDAVKRYTAMIAEAAEREVDAWPLHEPIALAPRMQAITLDVIMSAVFGVEGTPAKGTPERRLRQVVRRLVDLTRNPVAQLAELTNVGREEAVGVNRIAMKVLDDATYGVIHARRREGFEGRLDILSLLMQARDDEGNALTDRELRDELLTLVLAGHETTANSLAWCFERLTRTPDAYARLRTAVRGGDADERAALIEATLTETMRSRPVIPMIGRRVTVPWRLGEHRVEADTPVLMSIALLHHREDLYPDPYAFRPERFLDRKPGTYEWIPFGGGIRRCLGATLAMAEQRAVLECVARRTELEPDDPAPERVLHRNVTMIPARGARVVVRAKS